MTATPHPTPIPALAPGDREVDGGGVNSELGSVVLVPAEMAGDEVVGIEFVGCRSIAEDVASRIALSIDQKVGEASESASLVFLSSPVIGSMKYVGPVVQQVSNGLWQ